MKLDTFASVALCAAPLFAAAGCVTSHAEAVPVDPTVAVAEIVTALHTVAEAGDGGSDAAGRAVAREAWAEAHARFQRGLEPAMRAHCGDRETTALEYRFGRLGAAVEQGAPLAEPAEALADAVRDGLACIPAPAAELAPAAG